MKLIIKNIFFLSLFFTAFLFANAQEENTTPPSIFEDGGESGLTSDLRAFYVSVSSSKKGFLKNLTNKHFEIYDDGERREVEFLDEADERTSVGVLFDLSASIKSQRGGINKNLLAVEGFKTFFDNANTENEYFIQTFGEEINTLSEFTQDRSRIKSVLDEIKGAKLKDHKTIAYDALHSGIEKFSNRHRFGKILILISDGMDSDSNIKLKEIKQKLKHNDIAVYFINIVAFEDFRNFLSPDTYYSIASIPVSERDLRDFDEPNIRGNNVPKPPYLTNIRELDDIISDTGGRSFFPFNQKEVSEVFEQIAEELRSRYLIGFVYNETVKEEKWRKLEVKVNLSNDEKKEFGKIQVRSKNGYYLVK